MPDVRKVRRRRPTLMQIKTLQLVAEGNSVRRAMIKAGYSVKTANRGKDVFKNAAVQNSLVGLLDYVEKKGMNNEKMGDKLLEWIDAKKDIYTRKGEFLDTVSDTETQIKAYDRWHDLKKTTEENLNPSGKIKRRLTIEEFLNEPEPVPLKEGEQNA